VTATQRITDGVHRLGTEWVGWYLYAFDDSVAMIDCGFPGYRDQLPEALAEVGLSLESVAAIVLTHYHPDHVGSAERIRAETGATVYAPAGDAEGIRTGKEPMPGGFASSLWRPRMIRYMAHAARNGAARVSPVAEFQTYEDGDLLTGAGGLRAIHTPGHTAGHCSLLAERAGVLFAGDALAMFSFFSGEPGPQLLPFHEDKEQARDSLSQLQGLAAKMVVVGHGIPFEGTPSEAVEAARAPA
jgi:glyoxylase-like metal-dependent hydrolase (beta-lactamase superfamily II)